VVRWWQHAFAIPDPGAFVPTDEERRLTERVASELARRGLTLPAIVLMESSQPLGTLGAHAVRFVEPWFATIVSAAGLKVLAGLMERPGGLTYIVETLQRAGETPVTAERTPEGRPA
jgi:hypothetical protein